ncbi:hypothetical protein BSKO_10111 [Bryopsis sp. KO-2023]|nr:hypothetical protein BSKO_10111 [Bryopsis sp. KO-2023]
MKSGLVVVLFGLLVMSQGRPIRQLQETDATNRVIRDGRLSPSWTDWSWNMEKLVDSLADSSSSFCRKLDPYGALSLKSSGNFTLAEDIMHLSLQRLEQDAPSLDKLEIQLEGCTMNTDGYTITATTTLAEAIRSNFATEEADMILQNISDGKKVNLSLPLQLLHESEDRGCSYNRVTFGRCIKALSENQPCDLQETEVDKQLSFCIDDLSFESGSS